MAEPTAMRLSRMWEEEREIWLKSATNPTARGVSKGVYSTKSERASERKSRAASGAKRRSKQRFDDVGATAFLRGGDFQTSLNQAKCVLSISRVDDVVSAKKINKKSFLAMIRINNVYKIYEVKKTKGGKYRAKLIDKAKPISEEVALVSFEKELSRRRAGK